MRLDEETVGIIKEAVQHHAPNSEVYLFGSRVCDDRKGGDIDLLVRTKEEQDDPLLKARIQAEIQLRIGDQRIDVVITHEPAKDKRLVVHEALRTGVRL